MTTNEGERIYNFRWVFHGEKDGEVNSWERENEEGGLKCYSCCLFICHHLMLSLIPLSHLFFFLLSKFDLKFLLPLAFVCVCIFLVTGRR